MVSRVFFGALMVISFFSHGYADIDVASIADEINLTPLWEFFEDKDKTVIMDEIDFTERNWQAVKSDNINFSYTKSAYWFRVTLVNQSSKEMLLLLGLNYPHLKFIDLYIKSKKGIIHKKSGKWYPSSMRDFFERNFIFRLDLEPGKNECYMRISTDSPLKFTTSLFTLEGFNWSKNTSDPLYWIYYGFFLAIIIFTFSLSIVLRNLAYFFLFLFVVSLSLVNFYLNGFYFQYLLPDLPNWMHTAFIYFITISMIMFFMFFMLLFTGDLSRSPLATKIILPFVIIPGSAMALVFKQVWEVKLFRVIFAVWVIMSIAVVFLRVSWLSLKGEKRPRYILYSFSFFFAGITVYALNDFAVIPSRVFNEWSIQLGSVSMVIMLIVGIVISIKKNRDELASSEKRLSNILLSTSEGFIETDAALVIRDVNPALCSLLGYSREEVVGKSVVEFISPEHKPMLPEQREKREKGITTSYEVSIKHARGGMVHVIVNSTISTGPDGKTTGVMAMITDITERKKQEDLILQQRDKLQTAYGELEATNEELCATNEEYEAMNEELIQAQSDLGESLQEKEVLLREIHHRVKNNMQVITSLIHLQSEYISNEKDRELFVESENRVRSMALVHQKIYQSGDLAMIDFNEYLADVIDELYQVYSVDRTLIQTSITANDIFLSVESAIPCALIINEAVTNSIKHAFPGGRKGNIAVEFIKQDNGNYMLAIRDNGIGIPDDYSRDKKETLGMELIHALSGQLKGTLVIDTEMGTTIIVTFPVKSVSRIT
ncbi:MAG TPA: histidine kinase dimerization/phosphoacceptor domain -containing protein [Spirochaetota bacterium]|nr:histidine kinase dimerization/phosphoacceptor domain -containing protein [Spirochaetota bacterium]HPI88523.1 histidine kinase dimerization/phosphoacceptor domain -containing protein [Spirochaetota bacterium]